MAYRYNRINWQNKPNVATPISAENLNKMDKGIKDCDDAIGDLALLNTTNKTDLVAAVNELNNKLAVQSATLTASAGYTIQDAETSIQKIGNIVILQMVVMADTNFTGATVVATLPTGFKPAKPVNYMCRGSNIQWEADGIMYLYINHETGAIQVRPKTGESFKYASINCCYVTN